MTTRHVKQGLSLPATLALCLLCLATLATPVRGVLGFAGSAWSEPLRQGIVMQSVKSGLGVRSDQAVPAGRFEAREFRDESDDDGPFQRLWGLPPSPPTFEAFTLLLPRSPRGTTRVAVRGGSRPLRC